LLSEAPDEQLDYLGKRVVLVAAVAENGVIGNGPDIPWRIPGEQAEFKALTVGHTLLMGRTTFESIGRPLPGRTTIVLTRDPAWSHDGVLVAATIEEALSLAAGLPGNVMVAGGAQVYAAALPYADEQVITRVHLTPEGDVRYPAYDRSEWTETSREEHDHYDRVFLLRAELAAAATQAAYSQFAREFAAATADPSDAVAVAVRRFAELLGARGRVLEIGSGGGRDALALEREGLQVRRTDVSQGFVDLLREQGHAADRLDPLTDDLRDPAGDAPYDGVWAQASLLHVGRDDLPTVLRRLAAATRSGGVLMVSLKEGDGEGWSTHGSIDAPRHFTYWRERALRTVLDEAGWAVTEMGHSTGRGEDWLTALAGRRYADTSGAAR